MNHASGRSPRGFRRGFTLVELLLVMALVAVILGIGLGAFSRIRLGDRVAVALVEDALRSAHNFAVGRSAPARVRIDPESGTIRAEGLTVVGTWHFEGLPIVGAFGLEGAHFGGTIVDDGFQGKAISFAGEPSGARVELPVQGNPAWDLREGFALRCALRLAPGGGGSGNVLALGQSAGLETTSAGGLRAWIAPEIRDANDEAQCGGRIPVDSAPGALVDGRWSVVEVQYDRSVLRLFVDGALAAEADETAPVWRLDGPLVLSPASASWPGTIDLLVVSTVADEDRTRLPDGVAFTKDGPTEIVFAPGGGLDRDRHAQPLRLGLEFDDGRRAEIRVNLYGTVE